MTITNSQTFFVLPLTILVAIVVVFSNFATANTNKPKVIELDQILVITNEDVITRTELEKRYKMVVFQLRQKNTPIPSREILTKQILERLILEYIQLQMAHKAGIRINDETINKVISGIARQNRLSLQQFKLALDKDGFDFAGFRDNIRKEMIINQLRKSKVENRISVTMQEVKNQLAVDSSQQQVQTEYNISHILIPVVEAASSGDIKKAHASALQVLSELKQGADFSKMAISVSSGQKALQGGQLGWLKTAQLPLKFAELLKKMNNGDISKLVRSPSGFHILKLNNKRSKENKHIIEQTLARHILIKTDQLVSNAEARTELEALRKRILKGEDFAILAQTHSADPGSAAKGGSLGWVSPGTMVPQFEEEMNKLKDGELSQPFLSQFGWHIVQSLARRKKDKTAEFKNNEIRKQIHRRKVNEAVQNWLRQIRAEAFVEYRINN